uniref:CCHC-type domain-containing protein n=1 Tax=Globodera pallida TaxID=36090 RepID=A0A183C9U6_GLOPA
MAHAYNGRHRTGGAGAGFNGHFASKGFSGCFICGSKQHRAANCKVGSSCAACGQREHNSKSCVLLDKWGCDAQFGVIRSRLRTENPICFCCFKPHKVSSCRAKEASAFFRRVRGRERNVLRKRWINGESGSSMPYYCAVGTARKCDGLEGVEDELVLVDEISGSDESDSASIQILDHDNVGKDKGVFVVNRKKCRRPNCVATAADDGTHNAPDVIFVDDVIRNKWAPPIGHNAAKTELGEAELLGIEEDVPPSGEPALNSPCAKKVKKEEPN